MTVMPSPRRELCETRSLRGVCAILLWLASTTRLTAAASGDGVDPGLVVWTTPSTSAAGAMPLGNGLVGANLWVEEDGDLRFLIARTDAWSENCRLLKLGRVRVSLAPNPFTKGAAFEQRLVLRQGCVEIKAGAVTLRVFVDAEQPVIHVQGESATPLMVAASLECWRTERHVLKGQELQSSWTMRDAPDRVEVWEDADVIVPAKDAVAWYHRNAHSIVPFTLAHQGLSEIAAQVHDPILDRTFGGWMCGDGFAKQGDAQLALRQPSRTFALTIATHCAQAASGEDWTRQVEAVSRAAPPAEAAQARTAHWWRDFWARSSIVVEGDADAARVTRAYALQRWMSACASRGGYPIKFNGSIFTVDAKHTGGPDFDPDWRKWGGDFWWQNTRLPYYPMLASGDFDGMRALFTFYRELLPICRARARLYYGAEGAYFPETITMFGTYGNGDYGWQRDGLDRGQVQCPWWQWAWQQGLELLSLMLDYHDFTGDDAFAAAEIVPMAHEVLRYFDSRFARDSHGKLLITPTQAVETYWSGVVNDAPSVAGLNAVTARLLALPAGIGSADERTLWQHMRDAVPPLPMKSENGASYLVAAERFDAQRSNCETPELYALFPFRLFGVGRPSLDVALGAYQRRADRAQVGWTQDGIFAALLGLTREAQADVIARSANSNPAHRFPAMWGPNFDWLPDQDHGSNLMTALQSMVMQCAGDQILLLPAWPKEWNVSFKLHAPGNTTVEGVFRDGKMQDLVVTPEARRSDVRVSDFGQR